MPFIPSLFDDPREQVGPLFFDFLAYDVLFNTFGHQYNDNFLGINGNGKCDKKIRQ